MYNNGNGNGKKLWLFSFLLCPSPLSNCITILCKMGLELPRQNMLHRGAITIYWQLTWTMKYNFMYCNQQGQLTHFYFFFINSLWVYIYTYIIMYNDTTSYQTNTILSEYFDDIRKIMKGNNQEKERSKEPWENWKMCYLDL